jgi:uncharacterized protein with beta-barrel porin domain
MHTLRHPLPSTAANSARVNPGLKSKTQCAAPLAPGRLRILTLSLASALLCQYAWGADIAPSSTTGYIWGSNILDPDVQVNAGTTISATNGSAVTTDTSLLLGTLTNQGLITNLGIGSPPFGPGFLNDVGGSVIKLDNTVSGTITGAGIGLSNQGAMGTLSNSGAIIGDTAILNNTLIGTLTNTGTISGTDFGIQSNGDINILTNGSDGLINATAPGSVAILLQSNRVIDALNNNGGTINGFFAVFLGFQSNITTLNNNGVISGAAIGGQGILSLGTITTLNNNGTISGGETAITNAGAIGTLTNTGLITGLVSAISNAGSIGPIANNGGTIAGNINNVANQDLTLTGGAGSAFGTLTGASNGSGIGADNIGTITNTASNLIFASGNQLLNDNIDAGPNTVFNSGGVLQVNNPVTITGNYMQSAGTTLNIGVADGAIATGVIHDDSGYGRLTVSGTATLNAGSNVTLQKLNSYAFARGQRFVVMQATDAHYNADALNYSAIGYSGPVTGISMTDTDNRIRTDLILTLGSNGPINAATNPNAAATLDGLFRYTGTNTGLLNLFNAVAATADNGEANRAGQQLNPAGAGTALVQSTLAASQAVIDVLSAHIDTFRVAQAAGSANSGIATGERPGDVAMWGQAFGGQANQNDRTGGGGSGSSGSSSGYRADYNGMLIGADTALNDQWRAGGLFSYANTSVRDGGDNAGAGSSGHASAYGVMGYAGYAAEKWYLNLSAGAIQQKYTTFRNVSFTGFSGGAFGSFDGMQTIASAQAGYPLKLDAATTLTPIAGLTYSRLHQDGYTETGSAAALQIDSANTSSIRSDLGARLERVVQTAYGDMTPSAQLGWRHEYRDTGLQSVASFAADTTGTTSFTTQGIAPEKDTGVLVLGVTLAHSQNLMLAAHYTLEAGGEYTAQTADVRLRYQF